MLKEEWNYLLKKAKMHYMLSSIRCHNKFDDIIYSEQCAPT